MRRSNSFPGAILDDVGANKLTSSLTAQFESPAVPVGPSTSASSGDLDSESFADDWNASDEATTPSRCVYVCLRVCRSAIQAGALSIRCTPCSFGVEEDANSMSTLQVTWSILLADS